ncbi:MAG: hypothetical protein AB8H47_03725 [Bacteroidia bacterium]
MDSTRCSGWWEQMGIGRQEMDGLTVSIKEDTISGGGYDVVGMFTLEGTLTNGSEVDMIKSYLDKHTVLYKGEYDGSSLMKGTWVMSYGNGPWEIRFRDKSDSISNRQNEIKNIISY